MLIWWKCEKGHEWQTQPNTRTRGRAACPYCTGRLTSTDNCLAQLNPKLANEWHPSKNGRLTAWNVTTGANRKVWWKCYRGHQWKAFINARHYRGAGCPKCLNRRGFKPHVPLIVTYPLVAEQWHPSKNKVLTPYDISAGSSKKVWWCCEKGHEWQACVGSRTRGRSRCPYCTNKKVCTDNCLATTTPGLAIQWHLIKNGSLTPKDVTSGTRRKVWWKCERGHEWRSSIVLRAHRKSGCPYCANVKVCADNCLAAVSPKLAKEWHPNRNKRITPKDVLPAASRKVWWLCSKGHEWKTTIYHRRNSTGCPVCFDNRRTR